MVRFALLALLAAAAGCTNRSGTAFIEIENDQRTLSVRAEPILIDPRVEVVRNEYQRSYINEGSNIRQKIVIRGPIMIVPLPTTQPAAR